jgi:hypothetical protein
MVDSGFQTPTNRIIERGTPLTIEMEVETATNMYAGRLVQAGTTAAEVVVCDGATKPPVGWLGWEDTAGEYRPATVDTIYTVNSMASVLFGGKFVINAKLAVGFVAKRGDLLVPWGDGCVAPAIPMGEGYGVRVGFIKKTSEFTTGVVLPTGIWVNDVWVYVVTNASGTIDIGLLASESGDADGFIDGEDLTNAGWVVHNMADASAANITLGVLLDEVQIKDATPVYTPIKTPYVVGATAKKVTYTTTDATVTGNFYIVVSSVATEPVGKAMAAADASSAAADMLVMSLI